MLGLAIDTSYLHASIAVMKNDKILCFKSNKKINQQTTTLNLMIKHSLECLGLSFDELEYVAISIGPGRFTGLRIGISVANALYFALKIPLFSVSNFDAIAFKYQKQKQNLGIVLETGANKYYFQEYKNRSSLSEVKVINYNKLCELKNQMYLVGNIDQVDSKCVINAIHIAKFANRKLKNTKNLIFSYIKPQYMTTNYIG